MAAVIAAYTAMAALRPWTRTNRPRKAEMSRLSPSQLQAALDSLASAVNRAQVARNKIMEHCKAVYGVEPGDIDNDTFIDAFDGGSVSNSMSTEDFDKSMRKAMEQCGISMPER